MIEGRYIIIRESSVDEDGNGVHDEMGIEAAEGMVLGFNHVLEPVMLPYFDLAPKLIPYIEKTASFTLVNADSDKWLNCNHATTPIVITVPTGLTDGKQFFVFQRGAAEVSVVAGSGMTALAIKLKANAQYSAFQISIEGTTFKVIGETKV